MIEAGLHPTAQQVEANVQKLEEHEAEIANPLPQEHLSGYPRTAP
jgi:hypothetical protein